MNGNPLNSVDPEGKLALVLPLIPIVITGSDIAIGGGLGALGYGLDRMFSRGERGYAGNAGGTSNPGKHWKDDPANPGWVWEKNPQTGKKTYTRKSPYINDPEENKSCP